MVVVRAKDCALAADQFFACLAEVYKWTFVVDAVAVLIYGYAGATGVWEIDEIYDCASGIFFDFVYFFVGVFDPCFSLPLETYFPLDFDFDADLSDFLSSSFLTLLSLLFLLF